MITVELGCLLGEDIFHVLDDLIYAVLAGLLSESNLR